MGDFSMRDPEAVKIDGVKLRFEALMDLLAKMDAGCGKGNGARERRANERYSYRRRGLLVHLSQPDITLVVASRNLSVAGFSFLYRQMLYPGTTCTVDLVVDGDVRDDDAVIRVRGRVVSCRHVQGMVHEISVRFDNDLNEARLLQLVGMSATETSVGGLDA
jgi:hypothetical protein